jgi:hypothetical protein
MIQVFSVCDRLVDAARSKVIRWTACIVDFWYGHPFDALDTQGNYPWLSIARELAFLRTHCFSAIQIARVDLVRLRRDRKKYSSCMQSDLYSAMYALKAWCPYRKILGDDMKVIAPGLADRASETKAIQITTLAYRMGNV